MGSAADSTMYDYIIVGSGPAGVQMGYFMKKHGISHLILEGGDKHSMFTRKYPRHRNLISLNKRHNMFTEPEYNMRHDWNSLLCEDDALLFTKYSDKLFPDADDLVTYLDDFIERWQLNIQCNCQVTKIGKLGDVKDEGFRVTCESGATFTCRRLLMATGAMKENVPEVPGIELADTYGKHSLDLKDYDNKKIAIVGAKNSAFETGDHLAGSAAIIHFYTHSEVKMAWNTHFVGDLRAINNSIIDMYHLKSLHAIRTETEIKKITEITKPNGEKGIELEFEMLLPHWSPPSKGTFKTTYDKIIYCTGWKYVLPEMYEKNCTPEIKPGTNNRLPLLDEHWQSTVPHLYFMGTNMQARDKQSASGFIHGFRYNVRTLYHMLMNKYHEVELPYTEFKNVQSKDLAKHIIDRVTTTSALYQMNHSFLCDLLQFDKNAEGNWDVKHFVEIPSAWVYKQKRFMNHKNLWMLGMGDNKHSFHERLCPTEFAKIPDLTVNNNKCSAFTEPIIRVFDQGEVKETLFLGGSPVVRFDKPGLGESNPDRVSNVLQNLMARHLHIDVGKLDEHHFTDDFWHNNLRPLSKEELSVYKEKKLMSKGHVECQITLEGTLS